MNGWIILDKPVGLGSTQAVGAVKRALREGGYAKSKVGHGGTLDPLASGALPVAIGEATKLAGRMLDASKVYDFEIMFGIETDTLDAEGQIVSRSDVLPTPADVEAVVPQFTGAIDQIPPAYSALKIDGQRAYDRARAGEEVTLAGRKVTVFSLTCVSCRTPTAAFTAHVSKGTYVRSLARDIAHSLGTMGHVTMLRRTRAGPFTLDHAISLDKLSELAKGRALEAALLPLEAGLDGIPALALDPDQAASLRLGRTLTGNAVADGLHFAKLGETPVALVQADAGAIRVARGFNF